MCRLVYVMGRCRGICKTGLTKLVYFASSKSLGKVQWFICLFCFFLLCVLIIFESWELKSSLILPSYVTDGLPTFHFQMLSFRFAGFLVFCFLKIRIQLFSCILFFRWFFICILVFKLMSCTSIYLMCTSWWLFGDIGVVADCRDQTTNDLLSSCFSCCDYNNNRLQSWVAKVIKDE